MRKTGKLEETQLKKQVEMKDCQENEVKCNLDIQEEEFEQFLMRNGKNTTNFRIVKI